MPAVVLDAPYLLTARLLDEGRILMWPAAAFRAQVRATGQLGKAATVWIEDARNMEFLSDGQSTGPLTVLDLKLEPQPGTSFVQTNLSMPFTHAGTNWVPVFLKDMSVIEPPSQKPNVQPNP